MFVTNLPAVPFLIYSRSKIKKMNTEIFKKTFIPYHQKLYRVAYRILRDQDSAEDIVQETYIKLWNKREDLRDIENTEAYAIIILRNACLDFLRKKKMYFSEIESYMEDSKSLSQEIEQRDKLNKVKVIVDGLPAQQRLVMQLKHWEEYTDDEIEEITGMSQVNIRVTLSRARKTVREEFLKIEQQ